MIRAATPDELARIHPLIERAYRGDSARRGWTHEADLLHDPRTSFDVLHATLADPRQRLLVAWEGATPLGCVTVADLGGGRAYLGQLCVEPVLQAAGLGRRLIATAEEVARAFGATVIEMTVIDSRIELIAYYVRRGYREIGERRDFPILLDPPLHMTVLEKPLQPAPVD